MDRFCLHGFVELIINFKLWAKKNHAIALFLQWKKRIVMPANLNALIRYKTINSCLSGGSAGGQLMS
jgi:hypothetical protein